MKGHKEECGCLYCEMTALIEVLNITDEEKRFLSNRVSFLNDVNRAACDVLIRHTSNETVKPEEYENLLIYLVALATNNRSVNAIRTKVVNSEVLPSKLLEHYQQLVVDLLGETSKDKDAFTMMVPASETIN